MNTENGRTGIPVPMLGAGPKMPMRTAHAVGRFAKQHPVGAAGAFIVIVAIVAAILAPFVSPSDPLKPEVEQVFSSPFSGSYLLGGDQLGRDVFSRLLWGARISMYVGVVSVLIGVTAGALLGVISAYFGGKTDLVIQRVMDTLMAFPGIILALAIMAALGASVNNVVIALVIVFIPGVSRTLRSQALAIKEMDYVLAARAIGASDWRIILRHMLPNCVAMYIVLATVTLGWAIVVEASLSFLGVGVPPDIPSWGGMLSGAAQTYVQVAPWLAVFPGLAIAVVVFGINLLGDALRDTLDPRLRGA